MPVLSLGLNRHCMFLLAPLGDSNVHMKKKMPPLSCYLFSLGPGMTTWSRAPQLTRRSVTLRINA